MLLNGLQAIRFAAHSFDLAYPLIQFILYSRSYCHLCDDMLQALQRLQEKHLFTVEVIDIDTDEALVAQYDELVPVLLARREGGEPVPVCHHLLDKTKVEKFLHSGSGAPR